MVSKALSFTNTKQTSKNVVEVTFKHKEIINLVENETIFQNKLTVHTFNKYFCNIVKKIIYSKTPVLKFNFQIYMLKASIKKYENHPSIICIKDSNNPKLSFNLFHLNKP